MHGVNREIQLHFNLADSKREHLTDLNLESLITHAELNLAFISEYAKLNSALYFPALIICCVITYYV